jgi:putative SOS response-associated peptidase YedK
MSNQGMLSDREGVACGYPQVKKRSRAASDLGFLPRVLVLCSRHATACTRVSRIASQVGKPRKIPTWFAFGEDRPLFAFSGLWTSWRGVRGPKSASVDGDHELFGFLTTEPNAVVAPIHPKAMPVILTTPEEIDLWLEGEVAEALKLQRPLPDQMLSIVARSEKEDPPSFSRVLNPPEEPELALPRG